MGPAGSSAHMIRLPVVVLVLIVGCRCAAQTAESAPAASQPAFQFPTTQPLTQVPSGVPMRAPTATWNLPHMANVYGLAVSPDGKRLYASVRYSSVNIW